MINRKIDFRKILFFTRFTHERKDYYIGNFKLTSLHQIFSVGKKFGPACNLTLCSISRLLLLFMLVCILSKYFKILCTDKHFFVRAQFKSKYRYIFRTLHSTTCIHVQYIIDPRHQIFFSKKIMNLQITSHNSAQFYAWLTSILHIKKIILAL